MIKNNITKIFKKKNKRLGIGVTRYISKPKYAWEIIVSTFVVLNIGVIAFSGYLFLEINNGDIFKIEEDRAVSVETIDRTLLRNTLASFEKMESELKELKKNRPSVIDPSL